MMKITNRQIVEIHNNIGVVRKKNLPINVGFAINRNMKAMEPVAEAYSAEQRKILDKYCEKDEFGQFKPEGDTFVLSDTKAYAKEMEELFAIESEVQVHTVSMDEIEKCDNEKYDALTPNELSLLEFMIED